MKNYLVFLLVSFTCFTGTLHAGAFDGEKMKAAMSAQSADVQMRYPFRNPAETMAFFELAPGAVVVEALPGGGWYSRILAAYLGPDGSLIGADYDVDMFPLFGFFTAQQLEKRKTWSADWVAGAEGWDIPGSAAFAAFPFGSLPEEMRGTADTVLFIRALHNLARFEDEGGYLTQALKDAYDVLKPGGIVGVVQHEARPGMPDDWASGEAGYLKRDAVIAFMEAAGFEYIDAIEINQNEKDQPAENDTVWRLPPVMSTSRDDPRLRAIMMSIGESNRMTLKFRKPMKTEE